MMTTLAVAGFALLALAVAGVLYQSVGAARDARRFPPPGQLVDVGGHRLHAVCRGHGSPTVVLESAIAASSLSWARVQPPVARFTSVCAYDRAGLAWSDASRVPRTFARIVDELHEVLTQLNCAAPFVLVGHSFGVFVCLAYAVRYPEHAGGLVLVDPPSEWVRLDQRQVRLLQGGVLLSRFGALLARLGVVRICLALLTGGAPAAPRYFVKVFGPTVARTIERLVGEVRKLPPEIHPVVQTHWCQPKCFQAMADHMRVLPEATASAARIDTLGDVPLVVISSGDQNADVSAAHHALAQMSSRGRIVVASKSGHWVPYDEPELVVEAIREVVETVRRTGVIPSEASASRSASDSHAS
jgi:pimeloyl-ACP methyl ester carboxylesterase